MLQDLLHYTASLRRYWSFPKSGVPFLGFPIIRTIVFLGVYIGYPILGNCHIVGAHKRTKALGTPVRGVSSAYVGFWICYRVGLYLAFFPEVNR